jgi:hypothetical protein
MTQRQPLGGGGRFMALFFGCGIMIMGGVGTYYAGIRPLRESAAARKWVPTPCTVRTSRVIMPNNSKKSSSLDLSFSYHFGKEEFVSHEYSFMGGSYEWKVAVVDAHPVGERGTCFVNPAAPSQAVFERGVTFQLLSDASGALFFLAGGVFLLCLAFKDWRRTVRMRGQRDTSPRHVNN